MIKRLGDSTNEGDKKKLECEKYIKSNKSRIAGFEDRRRRYEQVLGGRGESNIIRYY